MRVSSSANPWLATASSLLLVTSMALFVPGRARAQLLQGSIDGNVTDTSQAVVAGAKVVAIEQQTNLTRNTLTNSVGAYDLDGLPPGTYTLTVTAPGFETYTLTGNAVQVNNVTRVNVVLTVGHANQAITVSAQSAILQTDRADVHTDVTAQTLNNLPVPITRNYQSLMETLPGVSPPQNAHSFAANPTHSLSFSVNGGAPGLNNTRIDGTSSTSYSTSNGVASLYVPALESIAALNVVTNVFDAEQGLAGGSATNIEIKSGTNSIHGSLFEDHSDQKLKAYPFVSDRTKPQPKYLLNEFGATLGGPIKKDKLFYFISYQGMYQRAETAIYSEVPTVVMKTGDLSGSPTPMYDPLTGNSDGTGRTPFQNNLIPTSRIDPGVQAIINTGDWANPNVAGTGKFGLGNNYLSAGDNGQTINQWDTKLSWNPNNKLYMFARFGFNDNSWFCPQQFGAMGGPILCPSSGAPGIGFGYLFSGTLAGTYVISPNLLIDAHYGDSRNMDHSRPPGLNQNLSYTFLGIPGTQSSQLREGGMPMLDIDNFAELGKVTSSDPKDYNDVEKEWMANVGWIKGSHSLRAGFDYEMQEINEAFEQQPQCSICTGAGAFEFSQGSTQLNGGPAGNDYNSFASFLLGVANNAGLVRVVPAYPATRFYPLGIYIRDQWQVSPKLTVTYGARFDHYPFPTRVGRGMETYDFQTNQMLICGVGPNPTNCGITNAQNFITPRVGIAYRLSASTVIRGGYGMASDPTNPTAYQSRLNFPDVTAIELTAPNSYSYATTLRQGFPQFTPPDYSSGSVAMPLNVGLFTYGKGDYTRGYIHSWNLTVEQRVKSWVVSVGYVGNRQIDPMTFADANWSPIGTGKAGQPLYQAYGRAALTDMYVTMGTNKYDSLQAHAEHHFSSGFEVAANYTFAKALGYPTAQSSAMVAIPYLYHMNYGPTNADVAQTFTLTWIAESPFGKDKRWFTSGLGAKVLGGWQLSDVMVRRTGLPFSVTAPNTTLNAVSSTQFGECIGTPQEVGNVYEWYNPATFTSPPAGQFGNCGINRFWGPRLFNTDLGLARKFYVRERFEVRLQAELFNVTNTPHHANPTNSVTSSTFMQALSIANTGRDGIDERMARLSLRFGF